jgi:AraC-like DNA-binding protein
VTEYRLKHACQLLRTTEMSVSEICTESGFGNISFFNKAFKKVKGNTPLAYRKLLARQIPYYVNDFTGTSGS